MWCLWLYVCACACACMHVRVRMCMYVRLCVRVYMRAFMCVHGYACVSVQMYDSVHARVTLGLPSPNRTNHTVQLLIVINTYFQESNITFYSSFFKCEII